MDTDFIGVKRNRVMARAQGFHDLYKTVRQMVEELNQGVKRYVQATEIITEGYIPGRLNTQKTAKIETYTRFVDKTDKTRLVIHLIRVNNIK